MRPTVPCGPSKLSRFILRAIGDGEKSVDPGAVEWLGERLTEAHETIDEAARHARRGGGA